MASPALIHMEKLKLRAGNTLLEFRQESHQALSRPSSPIWAWWEHGGRRRGYGGRDPRAGCPGP